MEISPTSKGIWIMREDLKKLEESDKQETLENENPENTLYDDEPIFVINEAPNTQQIHFAIERRIPVVVILSLEKFQTIPQRMEWQMMNIPELPNVCVDWAGAHSNVIHIKNKWRKIVKDTNEDSRERERHLYNHLKQQQQVEANPGSVALKQVGPGDMPEPIKRMLKKLMGGNDDDDGPPMGFQMILGPPPQ